MTADKDSTLIGHEVFDRADDFVDERFEELNLQGMTIEDKSFESCTFTRVHLAQGGLRDCRFDGCTFVGCDLSMVRLDNAALRQVAFKDCKLLGIDWSVARKIGFELSMEGCVLSYGSFMEMTLRDTQILDCTAHEVSFTGADLRGTSFRGTDLEGAIFESTKLSGANLSEATNYSIDPNRNILGKTMFSLEGAVATLAMLGIRVAGLSA